MSDKVFVDTNIWLYAFMEDESGKDKIAFSIISNTNIFLSTQVINEKGGQVMEEKLKILNPFKI